MTEEEAKTKWCPFAVASHTDPRHGFHPTDAGESKTFPCIASSCMAWRKNDERSTLAVGLTPDGSGWQKDGPSIGIGGAITHRQQWVRAVGFCGLAGRQ